MIFFAGDLLMTGRVERIILSQSEGMTFEPGAPPEDAPRVETLLRSHVWPLLPSTSAEPGGPASLPDDQALAAATQKAQGGLRALLEGLATATRSLASPVSTPSGSLSPR